MWRNCEPKYALLHSRKTSLKRPCTDALRIRLMRTAEGLDARSLCHSDSAETPAVWLEKNDWRSQDRPRSLRLHFYMQNFMDKLSRVRPLIENLALKPQWKELRKSHSSHFEIWDALLNRQSPESILSLRTVARVVQCTTFLYKLIQIVFDLCAPLCQSCTFRSSLLDRHTSTRLNRKQKIEQKARWSCYFVFLLCSCDLL